MDYIFDANAPAFDGVDLPICRPTEAELAISALAPTYWLEMRPELMVKGGDGAFAYLVCRQSGRKFVPLASAPAIVTSGTLAPLDFTPGAAVTRAITAESGEDLLLGGQTYSHAGLVRVDAGGAIIAGAHAGNAYPMLFAKGDDGNILRWWSDLGNSGEWVSGQSVGGSWKTFILSSTPTSFRIEVDGQGQTFPSAPSAIPSQAGSRKLLVGAAGAGGTTFQLKGKVVAAIGFAGIALHENNAARATVVAQLQALKAALA